MWTYGCSNCNAVWEKDDEDKGKPMGYQHDCKTRGTTQKERDHRDWLAGLAMTAIPYKAEGWGHHAKCAYDLADAMIREGKK